MVSKVVQIRGGWAFKPDHAREPTKDVGPLVAAQVVALGRHENSDLAQGVLA